MTRRRHPRADLPPSPASLSRPVSFRRRNVVVASPHAPLRSDERMRGDIGSNKQTNKHKQTQKRARSLRRPVQRISRRLLVVRCLCHCSLHSPPQQTMTMHTWAIIAPTTSQTGAAHVRALQGRHVAVAKVSDQAIHCSDATGADEQHRRERNDHFLTLIHSMRLLDLLCTALRSPPQDASLLRLLDTPPAAAAALPGSGVGGAWSAVSVRALLGPSLSHYLTFDRVLEQSARQSAADATEELHARSLRAALRRAVDGHAVCLLAHGARSVTTPTWSAGQHHLLLHATHPHARCGRFLRSPQSRRPVALCSVCVVSVRATRTRAWRATNTIAAWSGWLWTSS